MNVYYATIALYALLRAWILGVYKGTGVAGSALRDDLRGLSASRQDETTRDQVTARACPASLSDALSRPSGLAGRGVRSWTGRLLEGLRDGTNFLGKSIDTGSSGMICLRVLSFCQKPKTDKTDIYEMSEISPFIGIYQDIVRFIIFCRICRIYHLISGRFGQIGYIRYFGYLVSCFDCFGHIVLQPGDSLPDILYSLFQKAYHNIHEKYYFLFHKVS